MDFPLHLTGEMDKSVRCSCQIFSEFNVQKLLKSFSFWRSYSKINRWTFFWDTVYIIHAINKRRSLADSGSGTALHQPATWIFHERRVCGYSNSASIDVSAEQRSTDWQTDCGRWLAGRDWCTTDVITPLSSCLVVMAISRHRWTQRRSRIPPFAPSRVLTSTPPPAEPWCVTTLWFKKPDPCDIFR